MTFARALGFLAAAPLLALTMSCSSSSDNGTTNPTDSGTDDTLVTDSGGTDTTSETSATTGTISGTCTYTGTITGKLKIAAFKTFPPPAGALPDAFVVIPTPTFPQKYTLTNVPVGTLTVTAFVNQFESNQPGPTDPRGLVGGLEVTAGGTVTADIAIKDVASGDAGPDAPADAPADAPSDAPADAPAD